MTDLAAILARHVGLHLCIGSRSPKALMYDRERPCDAHQLGVALEAAPDGWVPRHHWQQAEDERAAAEARVQRLRTALASMVDAWEEADEAEYREEMDLNGLAEAATQARAALATEEK